MKTLYTLLFSLLVFIGSAQTVKFEMLENQPYELLTDATVLSPNYAWGFMEELVEDFGFTINSFNASSFSHVGVSEYEVVLLSDDFEIEQTLTPLVNGEEFWLLDRGVDETKTPEENESNPSLSTISYKLDKVGVTGEDVLKVEWKNVKVNGSSASDSINFQVWCYKDGVIEYHYGPSYLAEPVFFDEFEISFFEKDEMEFFYYYSLSGNPDSPSLVKDPEFIHYVDGLPKNGTVYRFYRGAIGIDEKGNSQSAIDVYPNPSSTFITLTANNLQAETPITFFEVTGKQVFSETLSANKTINISHLPNGIYFLELDIEGELVRKKMVKE